MNRLALEERILRLQSPDRPASLVNAVGFLIFQEMRIDPLDPAWPGGDRLLYSPCFTEVILDAFQILGTSPCDIPPAGISTLESLLRDGRSSQRIFCLIDADDAAYVHKVPHPNITVFCSQPPVDSSLWEIEQTNDLSMDRLSPFLRKQKHTRRGLWIVAPITGSFLYADQSTAALPALSDRMTRLGTETAFDVLANVNRLCEQGREIISFGLGEPDFDTPAHIRETAKKALEQGYTHYGPSAGLPELRQSIAHYIQTTRHVPVDPDEVVVTPGAKPIVFDVMMALLNPGDEVLYPNPGYPIYESVADWVGARPVPLPLWESKNWNFSIDELVHLITPQTKMIVLNSPGNPTGTLIGESELHEIARLAVEHNLWVVADEVYSQIVFDGTFHSIISCPDMKQRTILVEGFSKTYAMTGWRLGYGVMNKELAQQVAKIETNIDSCTCTFTQMAGVQALQGPQDESHHMVEQFRERSRIIVEGLNHIEGVQCLPAQGAFYVFPNVTAACRRLGLGTANELQKALLDQAGVAVLPRSCFGRKNSGEDQEYIRLSFATSLDNIREGLRRMKEFIEH